MKTSLAARKRLWLIVLGLATSLSAFSADIDALVGVLRDPAKDASAKGEACLQLMDLGPAAAPAVPALVGLLASPEEILRDYAVTTLERIGPPARNALPALRRVAAQDSSPEIRGLAREAIATIRGASVEPEAAKTITPETTKTIAPEAPEPPARRPPAIMPNPAATAARPPLAVHQGRCFRWAVPAGWTESESTTGVTLTAPDGLTSVSSALMLRSPLRLLSPGRTTPADFTMWILGMVPGNSDFRVSATTDLPDQPSGISAPWKVQEIEMRFAANGTPVRATWTCGIVAGSDTFDAFILGYQAPPAKFDTAKLWLAPIARSIAVTNPRQVAGSNLLLTPTNRPLDNPALLESWRQQGLAEDRISTALREGTMGYEHAKDPATGRVYEMPLESWDNVAGGYRNPQRPEEILQPAAPGE